MRPVQYEEILSLEEYALQRDVIRPAMIALRARRRLHLGEHMTLHFENRDSVFYQIQEMLRAEHITSAAAVRHELETYNELVPRPGELSATLMIEFESAEERGRELRRLLGLERHIWLQVGDLPPVLAGFDRRQFDEKRISSVQFLRFSVGLELRQRLLQPEPPVVVFRVDHPFYRAEALAGVELLDQLRSDLQSA